MRRVVVELDESQLDTILDSIQISLRTYQFITHNKKYLTEEENLRIQLITVTYEKIFNIRNQLEINKNETLKKNNKKIS